MEKEINCPLCKSKDIDNIEKLKTKDLVNLWLKQDVDTTNLFKDITIINKSICSNCGLEFFSPFISGDNTFYSKLGQEEWYYLHDDKTEFNYSNNFIKENDSVLDIGSGRGAFTKYIDKKISYTGLELSSKAVEYANEEKINVIESTIENYSISNKQMHDVVVTFQVLEHITNVDSFIETALEVIKPNGLLIIAVPNSESFIKDCQNHLLDLPPHHLLHWNEKSLKYIAYKYNLEIIDIYKEKLTNTHRKWHDHIMLSKKIRDKLGMETKSINMSFNSKVINKISSLALKVFKSKNINSQKIGMTIAIVLKKTRNVK